MKISHKNIIQKYIVLKINSEEWKPNSKIPSENQLAIKFHCSRLTAREAMQSLVYSGVLHAKRGSGYIVPEINKETSLRSFSLSHNVKKTHVITLKDDKWLKEYFKIPLDGKEVSIIKTYYDDKGHLATQFTILNKNIIWEIDKPSIEKSLTKFLAKQGVAIQYQDINIKISSQKFEEINAMANKLGWDKNLHFVEIITSHSQDGWVEKTIRISRPDALDIFFTKRNYL